MFTGSENGGKTMAVLFTLVSSCQRHGHDPFVYLHDVLTRLPDHPKEKLADLLPDRWTPPDATNAMAGTGGSADVEPGVCVVVFRRLPEDSPCWVPAHHSNRMGE